jgi:hypothetical protein
LKPQEVVEECERILKKHNLGGAVIAMDKDTGYYALNFPKESLFQWRDNDEKVTLSLSDASESQVEDEMQGLKELMKLIHYCAQAVASLHTLLREAIGEDVNKGKKHYVN